MKVIFSFDDGRSDAIEASRILLNYGLTGTFHVTTGFIDGTFHTDDFGINRKPLTIEQLMKLKSEGMEISSHGDRHILDLNDFIESHNKLKKWGICGDKIGLSVPNSKYTIEELNAFVKSNNNRLLYVRAGRSPNCYSFISKIRYLIYKIFKSQNAYNKFNVLNLNKTINRNCLHSVVVTKNVRCNNLIRFIEKYKNEDAALILMFHSIVTNPLNKWEYSAAEFKKICAFISKMKQNKAIECGTFTDFIKG